MFVAGDVGGTKTRLALFEVNAGRLAIKEEGTFKSADHEGLAEVLKAFLPSPAPPLEGAGFGVAGPVIGGRVKATNLPWEVDSRSLGALLGTPPALLLNDLEAMAWGIEALDPGEIHTLQEGMPDPDGGAALIAAGTGLGQALIFRHEGRLIPRATEGGHSDFAPNDAGGDALLEWIRGSHGHVSAERVVSGIGLESLYDFHHQTARGGIPPHHPPDGDRARILAESASSRSCTSCIEGFDLFLRCYGAEAGNLALKAGATAGLYVGGGIAAKNIGALRDGRFIRAFRAKGRYEEYMRNIPVKVLMNQAAPLLGAARAVAMNLGRL